jgi:hypothetical protein
MRSPELITSKSARFGGGGREPHLGAVFGIAQAGHSGIRPQRLQTFRDAAAGIVVQAFPSRATANASMIRLWTSCAQLSARDRIAWRPDPARLGRHPFGKLHPAWIEAKQPATRVKTNQQTRHAIAAFIGDEGQFPILARLIPGIADAPDPCDLMRAKTKTREFCKRFSAFRSGLCWRQTI